MWFHVINRGADRQDIFHDDADHLGFEHLIGDAVDRFGIEIHAWCQMTNHFHGLVYCPDDVLSETMHRICTVYAGRHNHRYERTGPLFEGRFRSKVVASDAQLLQTSRYIHRNPADIVGERAMVAYRWSTLGAYVGSRPSPCWLRTEHLLEQFGGDATRYRRFVEERQPSDDERVDPFSDRPAIGAADVDRAVARAAGVGVESLFESRRSVVNQPRLAAILLMIERRVALAADIAVRFGMSSPTSARTAARRARVLRSSDASFAGLLERATRELDGRTDSGTSGD